jgi:hypothetical protein
MNRTWKTLSEREKKIEELKYWVNMQSCDGAIDSIYIGNAEEICEELQLDVDEAYEKYEGENSLFEE